MADALSRRVPHTEEKLETMSAAVGEDEAQTARATFAALDEAQDHKAYAAQDPNCSTTASPVVAPPGTAGAEMCATTRWRTVVAPGSACGCRLGALLLPVVLLLILDVASSDIQDCYDECPAMCNDWPDYDNVAGCETSCDNLCSGYSVRQCQSSGGNSYGCGYAICAYWSGNCSAISP